MSALEMVGAFESTYMPHHDRDVMETTGHDRRWREDLELLHALGIEKLRYPIRWHRVEEQAGTYNWDHTDAVLSVLHDAGWRVIVDLVHHTSYPRWLEKGFVDPRFPDAYLRYVDAFFARYPWVAEYTLFNEPFSTLFLCGHERIWPPYLDGVAGFMRLCRNTLPAISDAARHAHALVPHAKHVWVDSCEHHNGWDVWGRRYARLANDRRFFVLDALRGLLHDDTSRPFVREAIAHGGAPLLDLEPAPVDILGLDYYAHCQWSFGNGMGVVPTPSPIPLADQIREYAQRYRLPCMLSETNLRGTPSDRATWFKYVLEQCEEAVASGIDLRSVCWFPTIDSADWDSLLWRCEGNIDPVGVYSLDDRLERQTTSMTRSYAAAARGAPAADLPAFRLQNPAKRWLDGYASQMDHWTWEDPPADEWAGESDDYDIELVARHA
jgi:beta-glucosidase/6-phospho-beta-glucosidase/beta-galactosidase